MHRNLSEMQIKSIVILQCILMHVWCRFLIAMMYAHAIMWFTCHKCTCITCLWGWVGEGSRGWMSDKYCSSSSSSLDNRTCVSMVTGCVREARLVSQELCAILSLEMQECGTCVRVECVRAILLQLTICGTRDFVLLEGRGYLEMNWFFSHNSWFGNFTKQLHKSRIPYNWGKELFYWTYT